MSPSMYFIDERSQNRQLHFWVPASGIPVATVPPFKLWKHCPVWRNFGDKIYNNCTRRSLTLRLSWIILQVSVNFCASLREDTWVGEARPILMCAHNKHNLGSNTCFALRGRWLELFQVLWSLHTGIRRTFFALITYRCMSRSSWQQYDMCISVREQVLQNKSTVWHLTPRVTGFLDGPWTLRRQEAA